VHALVMDFAKTFDKVSHSILISKLIRANLDPIIVRWILNFLSNRFQRTVIEGVQSKSLSVTPGVPQGSVLGPFLFLIFINDISEPLQHCTIRLFADDALAYMTMKNNGGQISFQSDINKLAEWATSNQMQFNINKFHITKFCMHKNKNTSDVPSNYSLYNKNLKCVDSFKYLGVTISNNLK